MIRDAFWVLWEMKYVIGFISFVLFMALWLTTALPEEKWEVEK